MYHVFFDGFILLVMGYTGKKALAMKLAYIEAFNAMRDKLEGEKASPQDKLPLTPDQQCTLHAIVKSKVEAIPEAERPKGIYPQIWSRFNNHFRIARYCQLLQSRLSEAIDYLVRLEIRPAAIGEGAHPLNGTPGFDMSKMPQSFGIIFDKAEEIQRLLIHMETAMNFTTGICFDPGLGTDKAALLGNARDAVAMARANLKCLELAMTVFGRIRSRVSFFEIRKGA